MAETLKLKFGNNIYPNRPLFKMPGNSEDTVQIIEDLRQGTICSGVWVGEAVKTFENVKQIMKREIKWLNL